MELSQTRPPLTPDDVDAFGTMLEGHMARNSTFHKQASIRMRRVSDIISDLDQNVIPAVLMQGQLGMLSPELGQHFQTRLQEFADDVNDLGETMKLLAIEYNEMATELNRFMGRIKGRA